MQAGTQWILGHATANDDRLHSAVDAILDLATRPRHAFPARLHLIYLVNDLMHHRSVHRSCQ